MELTQPAMTCSKLTIETEQRCEICSKLTIKWRCFGVFIVNFEQVNADWEDLQIVIKIIY